MDSRKDFEKPSIPGLLVAIGIIYGDIGTSPLYVMQEVIGSAKITTDLVYGALSAIVWTITMQTTLKYVVLVLRADNNGEGGILALYALVRRRAKWLVIPATIGASTLLADGIITPPISVASAVEGLRDIYPDINTLPLVIGILTAIFFFQSLGTKIVGKAFGPIMLVWFIMLAVLGLNQIIAHPEVFKALSPWYAFDFLSNYPGAFWLLGGIFLCTTGAEALYSDMGHCGRGNIRVSWIFVKVCLLLNYLGQGAWLIVHANDYLHDRSPFYEIMPEWWLLPGITIATSAAIIASQAMISGSFTLISEAIRLNFWPKVKLIYPSSEKGQLYVPSINWILYAGCVAVVFYFRESIKMGAAYGLAITITMLMTTILFAYYMYAKRVNMWWIVAFLVIYMIIELSFLTANLVKFTHGGFVTIIIASLVALIIIVWQRAFFIKLRLTEYDKLDRYVPMLKELSHDISIPKYSTHLVYMSNASRVNEIETKVIYSIFQKRPKRADIYWFVHVDTLDDPYTMEYRVDVIAPDDAIKVTFKLGFRVEQRINLYLRKVIEDMVKNGEVDITSRYESLNRQNMTGDFRFVVLERFLSFDNDMPLTEQMVMKLYFAIKGITTPEDKWFGLDSSSVKIEKVPLVIRPVSKVKLRRVYS